MSFWSSHFNHQSEIIGAAKVPKGVGDRYWGQDLVRDNRYLQGLAGRLFLQSFGVSSALLSGGAVTQGSSVTRLNITAAAGIADFDVDVPNDAPGWSVPAPMQTSQIPVRIESAAQTDFDISGATLNGSTVNYLKLRYAESNVQTRVKEFSGGSFYYSIADSFVLAADSSAPTSKDVLLASFIGNGTSTLTITQRYPIGPAGYLMTQCALLGMTYDGTDAFLAERVNIANNHEVGETIISSISLTPTAISASRTSANPTRAKYAPYIARNDADHDISTSQVPQWVIDALNAEKLTFNGISDFTGTLAAGVITFGSGTEIDHMLDWVTEQSMVNRWYASSEAANYGSIGGLFTGTAALAGTIAGVNYAILGCSKLSRTITLATYPANGSVTLSLHPGAIAGSTTSSRLRRLSGEALVAAGDVTGEVTAGGRRMGRILEHIHYNSITSSSGVRYGLATDTSALVLQGAVELTNNINAMKTSVSKTDGTTSLVTGKTNDPRTAGMAVYTHLAVVNATNWT